MATLYSPGRPGTNNCFHKVWQSHHEALQLWPLPGHHLQRATAAAETLCGGSLHDHCHCQRLPAELWGVPCCQSCSRTSLCLEPCHHVMPCCILNMLVLTTVLLPFGLSDVCGPVLTCFLVLSGFALHSAGHHGNASHMPAHGSCLCDASICSASA